jgi:hypothetical protein
MSDNSKKPSAEPSEVLAQALARKGKPSDDFQKKIDEWMRRGGFVPLRS